MKKRKEYLKLFAVGLGAAVSYGLFIVFKLYQKIPGLSCEGFGCWGSGILLALFGFVVLPLGVGLWGAFSVRENRLPKGLFAAMATLLGMGMVSAALQFRAEIRRRKADAEYQEALHLRALITEHDGVTNRVSGEPAGELMDDR